MDMIALAMAKAYSDSKGGYAEKKTLTFNGDTADKYVYVYGNLQYVQMSDMVIDAKTVTKITAMIDGVSQEFPVAETQVATESVTLVYASYGGSIVPAVAICTENVHVWKKGVSVLYDPNGEFTGIPMWISLVESETVHPIDPKYLPPVDREGMVLYTEQTLTEEQKAQARANIGVNESGSTDSAVLYTEQHLTDGQKAQARTNIGAVSIEEVEEMLGIEEEFSVSGELVEFDVDVEPDTELEVISKIHRDETWGLSDKLVLHQVSSSNFVDLTSFLGGAGTVFEDSGLTATVNADSTITIRGTNESSDWSYLISKYNWSSEQVYPAGTYTIPSGFMMAFRAAQYPSNVKIEGVGNSSRTVTIPEPFRIILLEYAVKAGATVDVTLPLGLFRGSSIPETGYEYSGIIHTVTFDAPVYEGEFNWATGELKDADGNTVGYYDSPKIKRLSGTNYFWTGFGENTISNVSNKNLDKVVISLGREAPEETVPSICDFLLTPTTKNYVINLEGDYREFFDPSAKLFTGMEVPLITTRGSLIVTNADGVDECKLPIPELINYGGITDSMTCNKVTKRWSDRFYITRDPDYIEEVNNGNPNTIATWIFSKKEFEKYGLPVENVDIPIVSPVFTTVTNDELESANLSPSSTYRGTFSYDAVNDNYVFKCRARAFVARAIYNWTSGYFCYPLKEETYREDNLISLYLAAGYSVRFEQDDAFDVFWDYCLTQTYCPFSDSKSLWNTVPSDASSVAHLIDTTPSVGIFIPRSVEDALYEAEHIAKRLNHNTKLPDDYEVNSYNWIGEGDGVTDYTDKIQSKLTEIHNTAGGGTIHLGSGTYPISKSLIVYSNTTIIGCGVKTTITQTADNTDAIILSGSNIMLRDFCIHLGGACTELTGCVYTNNDNINGENGYPSNYYAQNITIENVSMSGNYKFEYSDGRPILGDVYNNYKGVGIYSRSSAYFNYAHIDNVYFEHLMSGVYGGGGSHYFNIVFAFCKYGVYMTECVNSTLFLNGHSYYDIDENGEHISMSDAMVYIEKGVSNECHVNSYDSQAYKTYVFLGSGTGYNKIYMPNSYSTGSGSGTSNHEWNILKHYIVDYGRANTLCDIYKNTPFHIGSYTTSISKGSQLELSSPVIQNVLSGAGIWGNISSNVEFENNGIALRDVCRYPSEKTTLSSLLPYILSTVAPSVDNPIEIVIDYSNRPVIGIPNYIIQFHHLNVASDFVVSFDTTNTGVYDYEIPVTDNFNIVMVNNYPQIGGQFVTYRMKITFTKALQIADFKEATRDNVFNYNPDGLIGICNIGMTVNDYAGRSFLGECGGSLYGDVDMHQNTLKNLPNPVDDGDAVSKAYLEESLQDIEAALDAIIAIQNELIGGDDV